MDYEDLKRLGFTRHQVIDMVKDGTIVDFVVQDDSFAIITSRILLDFEIKILADVFVRGHDEGIIGYPGEDSGLARCVYEIVKRHKSDDCVRGSSLHASLHDLSLMDVSWGGEE